MHLQSPHQERHSERLGRALARARLAELRCGVFGCLESQWGCFLRGGLSNSNVCRGKRPGGVCRSDQAGSTAKEGAAGEVGADDHGSVRPGPGRSRKLFESRNKHCAIIGCGSRRRGVVEGGARSPHSIDVVLGGFASVRSTQPRPQRAICPGGGPGSRASFGPRFWAPSRAIILCK